MILLRRPFNKAFLCLIMLFTFIPFSIYSQELTDLNEDPSELMNVSLGDTNVTLTLTGTWKGSLQGNLGIIYSPLGLSFSSPETPLLFKQEADITLSLWINNKWFVEAGFQDNSSQNTYRAGYQGQPGNFIKYAGIGNTGLDFPSFPYLDLGGDSPSSFGFYSRMGTDSLDIHALFRYDAASREERIFTGSRERTISYIQPQNYIRGVSFVLPDENIDSEITVYIEDDRGTILDDTGRRWRIALQSQYAAGSREGLLELSIRPQGMVAVVYSGVGNGMGSYSGSGFLKEVQDYFGNDINLAELPQCGGGTGTPGYTIINGVTALVIYEPGTFSPFERQNRYDAPSSTSEQAAVVRFSQDTVRNEYELIPLQESAAAGDLPLFTAAVSQRNVYELLHASSSTGSSSHRSPQSQWPLAKEYPEIYLPARSVYTGDTVLRFTNYGAASGYFIGTDIVPGSIQVWRSGIQDSNFTFISGGGQVVLHSPVGQNEIIRITYLKRSEETRLGSIAAGIGAIYRNGASPFSIQGAVGVRWNITEDSAFTEEGNSSVGTVGISAKTAWEYDYLKAHIAAGLAFEQTDTTCLYRAAGMEGHQLILSMPSDTSFLSHPPAAIPWLDASNRANLIYRNYYSNNILGSTLMPITWNGSVVISGMNRPYPVKDPLLGDSQHLTADFILSDNEWTGFQIPVGYDADFISRAGEIIIPYRLYGFDTIPASNFKLIIQIGTLPSKDIPFAERQELVWEEEMDLSGIDTDGRGIAIFSLTEEERQKLGNATHLRLIVINDSGSSVAGRVILAPPVFHGASFRPVTFKDEVKGIPDYTANNRVMAFETIEIEQPYLSVQFPEIVRRLHPEGSAQRVLKVEWEKMENDISAGVDGRIGEIPLKDYREISFYFKSSMGTLFTDEKLRFIIASGPESLDMPYLKAEIPLNEFSPGNWSKVTIRYQGSNTGVFINGARIDGVMEYNPARINTQGNPVSYTAFFIDPEFGGKLNNAIIYIDEIILEDPCFAYRFNLGSAIEYSKPGVMLSAGNIPLFSDLTIFSAVESEMRMNENTNESGFMGSMINRTRLQVDVIGARVQGNVSFTAAEDTFFWSADHSISRSIGNFSFRESFFASPHENNSQHRLNLAYLSDFYARIEAQALYELSRLRQNWNFGIGYRPKNILIPSAAFVSDVSWIKNDQIDENENYGELWLRSWQPLVPDLGSDANSRLTRTQFIITQRTTPVGAILTLEGITNFTAINNLTRLENSLYLDIPIITNRINLNFRLGRKFQRHLNFSGNDVTDDSVKFFESIGDSMPLWGVFPGYSLFADELNSAMDNVIFNYSSVDSVQYTAFNDHFSTRISLPRRNDLLAFVVPSRASLRLERILEQKLDTRSDILNFSASLGFTALNMFGSMGYKPLFKFYQSDEFNNSLQAAVVFDNNKEISWRLQSMIGGGLRFSNSGNLNFVNTFTLRNDGYWTESFLLSWITPAEKILIDMLYRKASASVLNRSTTPGLSSLLSSDYRQLRRESLELVIDNSTDYLRWNIILGHEEIIRAGGRLEFTGFVKLRIGEDSYRNIFNMDMLLGTTLRVSF